MNADQQERSSEQIRRDIDRTRAEMDETVDALENRLSPGQLLDQAWGMLRRQGGGAGDVVREHPVPIALMGLGVAWLAIERATGGAREHVGTGTYAPAEGRVGPYRGDAIRRHDEEAEGEGVIERVREASGGVRSFIDDSPLAAGAIAFGFGLAAGLAAPTTELEDRLMGETADSVKREAKETAADLGERARDVAADAASAAREEADRQHIGDDLKESARRIASAAKHAAEERARQEDLTTEGVKDRVRESADRIRSEPEHDGLGL